MTRDEVFDIICTLIEEVAQDSNFTQVEPNGVETLGERILDALESMGEDLLDHLDPPAGLRRWLESHGLSLVVTSEITPPQVWEALQEGEAAEAEPVEERLEIEPTPQLGLGDYVEFQTATSGPRGQSRMGAGWVVAISPRDIEVEFSHGGARIILFPGADLIRIIDSPTP